MARPDWLPEHWRHIEVRAFSGVPDQWCGSPVRHCAYPRGVKGLKQDVAWCDSPDCEAKAKAAICGGDDGE